MYDRSHVERIVRALRCGGRARPRDDRRRDRGGDPGVGPARGEGRRRPRRLRQGRSVRARCGHVDDRVAAPAGNDRGGRRLAGASREDRRPTPGRPRVVARRRAERRAGAGDRRERRRRHDRTARRRRGCARAAARTPRRDRHRRGHAQVEGGRRRARRSTRAGRASVHRPPLAAARWPIPARCRPRPRGHGDRATRVADRDEPRR